MRTREFAVLQKLADADLDGDSIRSWDWMYYHTQQRRQDFGIDQNEVAEYFPLETVVDGMFEITGEVFGLEYREVAETTSLARRREAVRDPQPGRGPADRLLLRRPVPA